MSSVGSGLSKDSLNPYYFRYKVKVYENLIVGIICGIYLVFYVASIHILMRKPAPTLSRRPKMFLLGITTFMFVLGIVALALETALGLQQFFDSVPTPGANIMNAVITTIARLMYILSDIICAWRAVVLWNRDRRIIAILLFSILATTVIAGYDLVFFLKNNIFTGSDSIVSDLTLGLGDPITELSIIVPILATNVLSTGLIAWKAWRHRVAVRRHLGEGSGTVKVEKVLALLIESGFVYCFFWILYLILVFISSLVHQVADAILLFVSGLYPTLIVVLVGMQMSPIEHYSTFSTGMQFANEPGPGPPRAGGVPRYRYTNVRKSASDHNTQVPFTVFKEISDEENPENL